MNKLYTLIPIVAIGLFLIVVNLIVNKIENIDFKTIEKIGKKHNGKNFCF